jgi:hypothetical protein
MCKMRVFENFIIDLKTFVVLLNPLNDLEQNMEPTIDISTLSIDDNRNCPWEPLSKDATHTIRLFSSKVPNSVACCDGPEMCALFRLLSAFVAVKHHLEGRKG